jgi:hypothetical protein
MQILQRLAPQQFPGGDAEADFPEKLILPAVASQAIPVISRLRISASGSSPGSSLGR